MGGSSSKEEVVIAQSAGAGGQNSATSVQSQQHETTNIILIIICTILMLGILIIAYKLAKRCHNKQIQRRFDDHRLLRYASLLRRHQINPDSPV